MNEKLYAFWRYDGIYPYVLGGEIDRFNDQGMVYIKNYQAWFKPIHIVPLNIGLEIGAQLKSMEIDFKKEQEKIKIKRDEEIFSRFPWAKK